VHNLRDWKTQLAYARELKARGKTKYVGLTHYVDGKHDELADIMAAQKPDFIQINYSVSTTMPRSACCRWPGTPAWR